MSLRAQLQAACSASQVYGIFVPLPFFLSALSVQCTSLYPVSLTFLGHGGEDEVSNCKSPKGKGGALSRFSLFILLSIDS